MRVAVAFVAWSAACSGLGFSAVSTALASPADDAEGLIRQGLELRRSGHDEDALERFKRAESLDDSPRAKAQVGLAEQALGRWVEAARDIAASLRNWDDPWIGRNRAALERAESVVADHLGEIVVLGSPPGATVLINGAPAGILPLRGPVVVAAGEVVLTLDAPRYESINRKVTVASRGLVRETIDLPAVTRSPPVASNEFVGAPRLTPWSPGEREDTSPPPPAAAGRESRPTVSSVSWQHTVGGGMAALGLASLVLGVVEHFGRESKASGFKRAGCGTNNLSLGDCQDRYDQIQTAQMWLIVGYVGAVALGTGAAYLFWVSPSPISGGPDGNPGASAAIPGFTLHLEGRL